MSLAALEHKKQSRMCTSSCNAFNLTHLLVALYQSLLTHHQALKSLQKEHQKHLEREKQLGDILNSLRSGYNPNYQDMAVLEAVRGWEYFAGLPHINDVKKDDAPTEEELGSDDEPLDYELDDDTWTAEQLEKDLPGLLSTDYESLLIEHDKHIGAPADDTLRKCACLTLGRTVDRSARSVQRQRIHPRCASAAVRGGSGRPADVAEDVRHPQGRRCGQCLRRYSASAQFAPCGPANEAITDTSRAKQALNDAEHALQHATKEKSSAEEELQKLFDPAWFGREGEWKKLQGTCLEKNTGESVFHAHCYCCAAP